MTVSSATLSDWEILFQIIQSLGGFAAMIALGFSMFLVLGSFIELERRQRIDYWTKALTGWLAGALSLLAPLLANTPWDNIIGFKPTTIVLMLGTAGALMIVSFTLQNLRGGRPL